MVARIPQHELVIWLVLGTLNPEDIVAVLHGIPLGCSLGPWGGKWRAG